MGKVLLFASTVQLWQDLGCTVIRQQTLVVLKDFRLEP